MSITIYGGACYIGDDIEQCNNLQIIRGEEGEILCGEPDEHVEEIACCFRENREDDGDVNYDEAVTLISIRNAGTVRVKNAAEAGCCVEEGDVPDEDEVCCNNMPEAGPGGSCGCPEGFNPLGNACVPGGQICWSSDPNERVDEEGNQLMSCLFRWFTDSWWNDALNQNLADCFVTRDNRMITRACCPYINYDNGNGENEYGEYVDIEVY